ncbi:DUF4476 domain-containing protein [Hymenobacter sp. BT175]|uniref:DUF4476 domain-containing protein n=1 Tax=Hymenobacter translucens TaxID=2886507 RepID=UPI001D0EE2BB|nr:DUF4476 domain-containing protein [Hymenobacter translucens]MCC2545794.1 DUF4476 domain-containing protein [Hymenobacter translucens]
MNKALLFCCTLLLLAFQLAAAPANANFASERGIPFQLFFDGQPLTRGVARQVHLDRLAPGFHWAEFRVPGAYGRPLSFRTRIFLDPGLESSFVLLLRPGYPPALQKVSAVPIRYGRGNGYGPGYGRGYQNGMDRGYGAYEPAPNGGYLDNGSYNGSANDAYGNAYPNAESYRVMAPQDVDALLRTINNTPFDDTRLSIARQALSQTAIRTDDLRRLLTSFSFENKRVELAKYAYQHVADQQNFYRIYDVFSFQSSIQEIQRATGAN